jgi:hypothetical protein
MGDIDGVDCDNVGDKLSSSRDEDISLLDGDALFRTNWSAGGYH